MVTIAHFVQLSFDFPKLCECGCGQPTALAQGTSRYWGYKKGEAKRFRKGHSGRRVLLERFLKYANKTEQCWLWTGSRTSTGYGQLNVNGRPQKASRIAYELFIGSIPQNKCVLHNCPGGDNPLCVNPSHLWVGTRSDNSKDMRAKNRHRNKIHCGEQNGRHTLTEENVRQIRKLFSSGIVSPAAIAKQLSLPSGAVWGVIRGVTWKWFHD